MKTISKLTHKRICRMLLSGLDMQALEIGLVEAADVAAAVRFSKLYDHDEASRLQNGVKDPAGIIKTRTVNK